MAGQSATTVAPLPRKTRGLKHGLYSDHILVLGECAADWDALRDGLRQSLRPVGMYEAMLVDKAAMCLWRNARLARAEWADAEEHLLPANTATQGRWVDERAAASVDWETRTYVADPEAQQHAAALVAEIDALSENEDWHPAEVLRRKAPTLWQALCEEAGSSHAGAVARHVTSAYGDWQELLMSWRDEAARAAAGALSEQEALHVVAIVTAKALAPQIANAKFLNYQAKLDANLRAVMRELRETQRHRLAIDAAVVAEG